MNKEKELLKEKNNCLKHLKNPEIIKVFYKKLKYLSLNELKSLFPVPANTIAQTIFDCSNEIIAEPTITSALKDSLVLFSQENFEKSRQGPFQKDMCLLQALFFFLIQELFIDEEKNNKTLFEEAIKDGSWRYPEKQAEILNKLASKMKFNRQNFFIKTDFNSIGHKHYDANESLLRLFYNFMHPVLYANEGIVNELNFVREQQKNILPIYPNTKKTIYNSSTAKKEINEKKENLKNLSNLDFGFTDINYSQSFFFCDKKFKETFSRPITCKCFQETDLEWEKEPEFNKRRKIICLRKSDRSSNKKALNHKYLYLERNIITHISDNSAVHKLLGKEVGKSEMKKWEEEIWEELILDSLYDARQYILKLKTVTVRNKLLAILNHYFQKITDNLHKNEIELKTLSVEKRWNILFDEDGDLDISTKELEKTNLYNILSEDEIIHFKRFMGFMYCSENDESDFFERNRCRIQLYLIYISLSLSMMDK